MKWPWVSREVVEGVRRNMEAMRDEHRAFVEFLREQLRDERAAHAETRSQMHALRVSGANAPVVTEPVVIEPPELPPPKVLGAIQFISPVRDKVYDANWAYWEANKERAAQHPEAFALEILNGSTG